MKLSNWATALDAYITEAHRQPFSYDRELGLDCCTFSFGAIHAQTGQFIGSRFSGQYRTRREALEVMKMYCGRPSRSMSIAKLMKEYSFHPTPAMYAQRGDAVLVPKNGSGEFLGILDLNGRDVLSVGDCGLRRAPLSIRCRAWRIA